METITSISTGISIIAAIIAIFLNKYVFHEHKRKKFKAELENYEEYFSKYYDTETSKNLPLLIRDKAAQNLTRLPNVNSELVNYFINLHEKSLVSFDKIIDHFNWGEKFINIKKVSSQKKFKFTHKFKMPKFIRALHYIGYVLFILYAIGLVTNYLSIPSIPFWLKVIFSLCSIFLAFICLNKADDITESFEFLKLIDKAQLDELESTI
ncbi:hypothetical protein [Acinetobacter silvestris]|uniref:Uncharacterized protein n=1 Tax=Acinetobacter silvestris TaxID=1977882 RepID=A0A1Y3C9T7_9GAMM|nr:hypothetical protein [Acinetobacter silvestris]OTG63470.1 hypothetical protein B9T28_13200 [Acinetobacter silvestris]